jgi:hypothetical protein
MKKCREKKMRKKRKRKVYLMKSKRKDGYRMLKGEKFF